MLDVFRRAPVAALVLSAFLIFGGTESHADGDETLGPPSVAIADGTGFVASGSGMLNQPGLIELTIPVDANVEQVLLYWNGFGFGTTGSVDDTILIEGIEVTMVDVGDSGYVWRIVVR